MSRTGNQLSRSVGGLFGWKSFWPQIPERFSIMLRRHFVIENSAVAAPARHGRCARSSFYCDFCACERCCSVNIKYVPNTFLFKPIFLTSRIFRASYASCFRVFLRQASLHASTESAAWSWPTCRLASKYAAHITLGSWSWPTCTYVYACSQFLIDTRAPKIQICIATDQFINGIFYDAIFDICVACTSSILPFKQYALAYA